MQSDCPKYPRGRGMMDGEGLTIPNKILLPLLTISLTLSSRTVKTLYQLRNFHL